MTASETEEFAGTSRFVVEQRLGAGGMGVVYRVYDRERDVRVALKVLPHGDPAALIRFKREFRSLASIVHPNLVELYELFADDDRWFFTMAAIDGVDFLQWNRPAGLDVERLRGTLRQLVRGVAAIHAAGRLHGDLKPSNVMVRSDGTTVILDFGLVSELGAAPDAGAMAGTAPYMAPEQWGSERLTAARDWYAVGVMLHEALHGALPFTGKPSDVLRAKLSGEVPVPAELPADVPPDFDALCRALLRRDPSQRPGAADIVRQLGVRNTQERAILVRKPRVLVGRERHLALLDESYASVESGATVTAHVHGPSGTGKSAILEHFLRARRQSPDAVVLAGRCYEQESVPYKALDSLVDALAVFLAGLDPSDVEPLVPVHAAVLARVFPALQRVPAIARAPAGAWRISDPRELRRAAVAALREMLTRIGQRRHLVLVIDDLQWGDVDSAAVIGDVLHPPDPPRMLLVLAYRSEYTARSACLATLLQLEVVAEPWQRRVDIAVEPLSEREGTELARRLLGAAPGVTGDDMERIARESRGNPYFIEELTRHLDRIHTSAGRVDAGEGSGTADLDLVLWSRVQRLPATAQELLSILAVAGQPLELRSLLATASPGPDVQHALALLRAEHFVRSTGTGLDDHLETYHDRVRESVTSRLPADAIRGYHAGLAATLEATGVADAETVAEHFEGAGELAKAGEYYARGASEAASALAFDRAATLYRRALRLHSGDERIASRLQQELGNALANAGRGFEAAEAYLAAVQAAPPDERFDLERLAAEQYCISGYVGEGRVIFRRLLERVGLGMPSHPASILGALVLRRARLRLRGLSYTRRPEASVDRETLRRLDLLWSVAAGLSLPNALSVAALQTTGLMLALDAGEPYRLARALAFEAFLTGTAGWSAARRASALTDMSRRLAEDIDHPHALGVMHVMSAMIAHVQSRWRDAIRDAEIAEDILRNRCSGVWWEIGMARTIMCWAYFFLGECETLRQRNTLYLAEARDRGDRFLVTNLRSVVSPFLLLLDDEPDAAARELDDAMASWPRDGFDLHHANQMYSGANIQIYAGNGLDALRAVDARWGLMVRGLQLQAQMVRLMMTDLRARAALTAARAAPQGSERTALVARAERDARRLAKEGTNMSVPFGHCLMAGVASLRGDAARTVHHLREGLRGADAVGDGFRAIATRYHLGELLGGEEGAAYRAAAAERMAREKIRNPARLAALFIPMGGEGSFTAHGSRTL